MIALLSGEPGLGKTLTAESVAEEMRRPLYFLSAGELGDTVHAVEENLQEVLEISTKWNAVLLLDECDIFLEKRTTSDLQRNKLITVFLRLLEYYKGVMFLTTNRMSTFDPAFQSRIHLSITYPELDRQSRRYIWQTFLRPRPGTMKEDEVSPSSTALASEVTEQEIDILSAFRLNGREIKNTIKTARLLANSKEAQLKMEHIRTVLGVRYNVPGSGAGTTIEELLNKSLPKTDGTSIQELVREAWQNVYSSGLWRSIQDLPIGLISFGFIVTLFAWRLLFGPLI